MLIRGSTLNSSFNPTHLGLLGLLLFSIIFRLPGVLWPPNYGDPQRAIMDSDETTHVEIADDLLNGHEVSRTYIHGFPSQIVAIRTILLPLFDADSKIPSYYAGRALSLLYALGLTCLFYNLILQITGKHHPTALMSAVALNMAGLFLIQGHMATADMASLFYIILGTTVATGPWRSRRIGGPILAALAAGLGVAVKFNPLTGIGIAVIAFRKRARWWVILVMVLSVPFLIFLANAGTMDLDSFVSFIDHLLNDNLDLNPPQGFSRPANLLHFAFGGLPSFGLPLLALAFMGLRVVKKKWASWDTEPLVVLGIVALGQGILIVPLVANFYRHLLPILPLLAFLAGAAAIELWQNGNRLVRLSLLVLALWQYAYDFNIEWWFARDPRHLARIWVEDHVPPQDCVNVTSYTAPPAGVRWKAGFDPIGSCRYLVLNDCLINRFRFPSQVLGSPPESVKNVFHSWGGQSFMDLVRSIDLPGSRYESVAHFDLPLWAPEFKLAARLLGSNFGMMSFIGSSTVYRMRPLGRPEYRGMKIPILAYHKFGKTAPTPYWLSTDELQRQLGILRQKGFQSIPLSTLLKALHAGGALPPKPIILTFDDGVLSQFELAAPLLERYRFHGTFFIPTAFITEHPSERQSTRWDPDPLEARHPQPHMVWPEIKNLLERGHEIGSHGRSHREMTDLPDERVRQELAASLTDLKRHLLLKAPLFFSAPFATWEKRLEWETKRAGYSGACTQMSAELTSLDSLREYDLRRVEILSAADFDKMLQTLR